MSEGRKYCVDCKHFRTAKDGPRYGRCARVLDDDVRGVTYVAPELDTKLLEYASIARSPLRPCKPEALLFEPVSA